MVLGLCISHRVNVFHTVSDCAICSNLKWVWLWPEEITHDQSHKKVASAYMYVLHYKYICICYVHKVERLWISELTSIE